MGKIVESVSIFDDEDNLIETTTTTRECNRVKPEPVNHVEDDDWDIDWDLGDDFCDELEEKFDTWKAELSDKLADKTAILKCAAVAGGIVFGLAALARLVRGRRN